MKSDLGDEKHLYVDFILPGGGGLQKQPRILKEWEPIELSKLLVVQCYKIILDHGKARRSELTMGERLRRCKAQSLGHSRAMTWVLTKLALHGAFGLSLTRATSVP